MTESLKPGISVIVMAHERQYETLRAIDALLKIDFGCETQIIVSDNPSTPDKAIRNIPRNIVHKLRNPSGDSLWHANQILKEVDHEWTLLTHDDDEMLPRLGELFRENYQNPNVMMITGKSRIIVNNSESTDIGYLARLDKANLLHPTPTIRNDLFDSLFDIGPLFPASAMIVRTAHLLKNSEINPDFDLAGDLAHSMSLARNAEVVFDGGTPVMNYHIHGGNSVFSAKAAGGLMSDFCIVRLSLAIKNDIEINQGRKKRISKGVFVARILANAFHLGARYKNVKKYAAAFNEHYSTEKISWIWLLPVPLGPLKLLVRRLMWKRLGVNKWGY
jgi:DNA-binding protein